MEMGTIRTKVSRSHSEIIAFLSLTFSNPNPTYDTLTVMSPNIARPLTLHTSPSDYATFNQIRSFLIFNIMLLLEREKQ